MLDAARHRFSIFFPSFFTFFTALLFRGRLHIRAKITIDSRQELTVHPQLIPSYIFVRLSSRPRGPWIQRGTFYDLVEIASRLGKMFDSPKTPISVVF